MLLGAVGPAAAVAEADQKEAWLLRRALASGALPLPDSTVQLCLATLRGPREAVCARGDHALDVVITRELWLAQLEATASARALSSATIASGSSAE